VVGVAGTGAAAEALRAPFAAAAAAALAAEAEAAEGVCVALGVAAGDDIEPRDGVSA
jgi:hypothetical protein